jgi:DNA-binding CsgD family transcriptional regulator
MHQRSISYQQVAHIYGISVSTVSRYVKQIDQVIGVKQKMKAVFRALRSD